MRIIELDLSWAGGRSRIVARGGRRICSYADRHKGNGANEEASGGVDFHDYREGLGCLGGQVIRLHL